MSEDELEDLLACLEDLRSQLLTTSRFASVVVNDARFCSLFAKHGKVKVVLNVETGSQG